MSVLTDSYMEDADGDIDLGYESFDEQDEATSDRLITYYQNQD